ncbi:MAG: FHA domain-containing protein [Acidimicrobiia bacterium]
MVKVGRAVDCDVKFSDSRVSRIHLFLEYRGGVWILTDRSSSGTFSNGKKFNEASIPSEQVVRLGSPDGPELRLTPVNDAAAPSWVTEGAPVSPTIAAPFPGPGPTPPAVGPDPAPFPPVAAEPPLQANLPAMTVAIGDRLLRLRPEGAPERVFPPGPPIVVGRDPECDIVIDDPLVSRHHVRFTYDGTHWFFEDLGSSRGTYFDGRRTTGRTRAEGAFSLWLGGIDAGAELGVVSAGEHRVRRSKLPIILSAAAIVLVLIIGVVALAVGGDSGGSSDGKSALPPVKGLAKSVVLVAELTDNGDLCARGSGSILGNGLILTNFHVVAAEQFQNDSGDTINCGADIHVLAGDGQSHAPSDEHPVEVVVADPKLDLAIVRVKDDFPYPAVKMGNSSAVQTGDAMRILGYPGIGGGTLTVTDGIVSGFESERPVGNRAWFKTDTEIARGNSGGSAFDREGRLIGIPTQSVADVDCSGDSCQTIGNLNRIRPVDFAKPLIRQAANARPIPYGSPRLDSSRLDHSG